MAANGKRTLEDILEEHLAVTKAGFDRVNQNIAESTLALRLEMSAGFKQMDARFQQVDARFQQADRKLDHLSAIKAGIERLEGRFDNLLIIAGARSLDHEQRLQVLEAEVAKIKAG
jgi:hypothetical protein